MSNRKQHPFVALVALSVALIVIGCGSESSGEDPQAVLEETFSSEASVDSGVLEISLAAEADGDAGGAINASLEGPFQARDPSEVPLLDLEVELDAEGQGETSFDGGLLISDDGAFITVDEQAYEVDRRTFSTFSDLFAQSTRADRRQGDRDDRGAALFERLGIDPAGWLSEVSDEGTEEIDGVETIHISGTADVAQIAEDAERIGGAAQAGGADTGELSDSVRSATIDVFTGAEDRILRRLELELELEEPDGGAVRLALAIGISDVNGEQSFEAPEDAVPLQELIPGGLGGLGLGTGDLEVPGGGSGGGGQGDASGAPGSLNQEYLDCVRSAPTPEDVPACAELLR